MAFSSADWTIDYGAKTVTNNDSGTGNNVPATFGDKTHVGTVLAFFQWLATEFASSGQMDDTYPIESQTPTVYKWLNTWSFGHAEDTNYLEGGSVESSDGNDLWANVYSIGSQVAGTQLSVFQNDVEITPYWGTDNIDLLIKVKTGGVFTQSDNTAGIATDGGIWVYAREFGDEYDHNFADLSGGGRTPIGINTAGDGSNNSLEATVQAWYDALGFTITFGSITRDLNNGNGLVNYDCEINCDGRPMTEVYEVLKLATRYGETIDDLNGDDGQEYRSADEGNYPEVKKAPFGTIAGTTLYGAQGIWFTNYATADFVLKDSTGTEQSPPDYQKTVASHPSLDGCNVFVTEISGGNIVVPYSVDGTATTTATTLTVIEASIDANKVPQSGTIRIDDDATNYRYSYTGFNGQDFTGIVALDGAPSIATLTNASGVIVPLLDETVTGTSTQSDNVIYVSDFEVRTSVRKYGFKPYDVDTSFTSAGLNFVPILSNDPQAT